MARESHGYPCLWHDMMMMMIFTHTHTHIHTNCLHKYDPDTVVMPFNFYKWLECLIIQLVPCNPVQTGACYFVVRWTLLNNHAFEMLWREITGNGILIYMVKQFYLTHRWDPNKCYHSKSEWTWEQLQWKSILYSPKIHVGWLVGFTAYQPFSGHLTPN